MVYFYLIFTANKEINYSDYHISLNMLIDKRCLTFQTVFWWNNSVVIASHGIQFSECYDIFFNTYLQPDCRILHFQLDAKDKILKDHVMRNISVRESHSVCRSAFLNRIVCPTTMVHCAVIHQHASSVIATACKSPAAILYKWETTSTNTSW